MLCTSLLSSQFIIDRPQEIKEHLESFTQLEYSKDFEIVIIEDGSTVSSEEICNSFSSQNLTNVKLFL